jgi:hypothetical protein
MRKTLLALGLAGGVGLVFSQSADAVLANVPALKEAATSSASTIQRVQYDERQTRRGMVKCYRDFVIGPYRCHYFR